MVRLRLIDRPSPSRGSRDGAAIDMLVLHYTGMPSTAAALDRLCDPAAEVSAHYLIAEDGTTYRFVLRSDGRWSNGEPVTAGDFVYSLRRIMDPATGAKYAEVLFPIAGAAAINRGERSVDTLGVSAPDERTVEIRLEEPTPYFLELITHQTAAPVHAASVKQFGESFTRPGNLVTNGPYRLIDNVPGDRILLEANPHHPAAASVAMSMASLLPDPKVLVWPFPHSGNARP